MSLLFTLKNFIVNYFSTCSTVSIVNFEQVNDGWVLLLIVAPWIEVSSGYLEKKLNVKNFHNSFRLVFPEEFFVDFRTWSIKGGCTLSKRMICLFILISHTYTLHRSRKFYFPQIKKLPSSVEFRYRILS